jgi:nickel-dependent lactate racemase
MAVEAERAALVLVSPAHPGRERDLVQAHKILRQGATLTADAGTLIALAACRDGIGSSTLMDWFDIPPADLPRAVAARYTLHGHTALAIRAMTQRIRVVLVSELPAGVVQRIGMVPAASLGEALAMARREHRPGTRALLLPRAGSLLPIPLN